MSATCQSSSSGDCTAAECPQIRDGEPWRSGRRCPLLPAPAAAAGLIIFAADHPLVLNGTYDQEGYKPGERERIRKAKERAHSSR